MTVHCGKHGWIDGVPTMRLWSINDVEAPPRAYASNTKLGAVRRKGVRSWAGSYQCYGAQPVAMPGDMIPFLGYGAPNDDVGGNGLTYAGEIIIDSVDIMFNWRTAEIINYTTAFSGNLGLTVADGAQIFDAPPIDMPPIALAKVPEFKVGAGAFGPFPNVGTIGIKFSAANQSYVNSGTLQDGILWTGRCSGPVDWTAAINQDDDSRLAPTVPLIGDDIELKIWVDQLKFWSFKWGHVKDYSGLTINRETGAVLSRTVNVEMTAFAQGDDNTIGAVLKPDGIAWWPAVAP